MRNKKEQINCFVEGQKKLIANSKDADEEARAIGVWIGFVTGLRMTKAITFSEYSELFKEIETFTERTKDNEEKTDSNITGNDIFIFGSVCKC